MQIAARKTDPMHGGGDPDSFPRRLMRIHAAAMDYSYVFTDEQGTNTILTSGQFEDGARPPDAGDSVTLTGEDGVDRPWKILAVVDVPYGGVAIHVEPLESG